MESSIYHDLFIREESNIRLFIGGSAINICSLLYHGRLTMLGMTRMTSYDAASATGLKDNLALLISWIT
jgi:hypothetical protein